MGSGGMGWIELHQDKIHWWEHNKSRIKHSSELSYY